ncbi:MAG TPA: hypothetical protein ENK52_05775 [Saprospiraceae bacterium]|nr:hypothetical protein [Saprospiraceae bacterium]
MLLAVGTKVKFKNSGDVGKVTALLDDGMVQVYIPADDMEIPAFIEDLILADDPRSSTSKFSAVNAKFVKGKQVKKKEVPKRPEIQTQYTILKGKGIQLAFDPQINEEGITESYQMYLINDTRFDGSPVSAQIHPHPRGDRDHQDHLTDTVGHRFRDRSCRKDL